MSWPCPLCEKSYQVGPEHVGRKILCKQCGNRLLVTPTGLQVDDLESPSEPELPAAESPQQVIPPEPPPPPPEPELEPDDTEPDYIPRRRHRRRGRSGAAVRDLVNFRLMITPILIQVLFWVGTVGCGFAGVWGITSSVERRDPAEVRRFPGGDDTDPRPAGPGKAAKAEAGPQTRFSPTTFAAGVAILVLGPLVLRIYCETAIIFFKIHDELKVANDRERSRG